MKFGWALALAVASLLVFNDCSSHRNAITGTGFVWVATTGDQKINTFTINESTGAGSHVGGSVSTGVQPTSMVMTPDRKTLFVANRGDNTITAYSVNTDGSLKAAGSPVVVPGVQPAGMAIDPTGSLLFVANEGSGTISVFTASGTSLSPATVNSAVPAACGLANASSFSSSPNTSSVISDTSNTAALSSYTLTSNVATLTISPAVSRAFLNCAKVVVSGIAAPDNFLNGVWTVAGTPSTTQLMLNITHADVPSTSISGAAVQLIPDAGPVAVAVSPTGAYLYIANQSDNTVSAFPYSNSAGSVTIGAPLANSPYSVGTSPAALAFSRCAGGNALNKNCTASDRDNLFVANSGLANNVSIFSACIEVTPTCTTADGTLQQVNGSPVPSNAIGPSSFIVDPLLDFVYVVDTQSNQISQFAYSPATGMLTPLTPATVSTGASPGPGGITSDGSFVMVPDGGASQIDIFRVGNTASTGSSPSGQLSRPSTTSITLGAQPTVAVVR